MYSILMLLPLFISSCGNDEDIINSPSTVPTEILSPVVSTSSNFNLEISTDKALYNPGSTVTFSIKGSLATGAKVRYRHGSDVIAKNNLSSNKWTWTVPSTDYKGYMADIYTVSGNNETLYATIGIDVSSDWAKFPRYGFVSKYDTSVSSLIPEEMSFLNRCHINGIQFYDWQNKHHWPLGGTVGNLSATYKDIANRDISTDVVKQYISTLHNYGMKCMFYNLCYGALSDATDDGVKKEWYMYKDAAHSKKNYLDMSDSWKSDIFLMNPADADWQNYLADRNDDVYASLDFDGYHVDQIGDQGTVYDYYGGTLNLASGFESFLNKMKTRQPSKRLVMNAVSNFGAKNIVNSGDVDFMYTELWGGEDQFIDLLSIQKTNKAYCNSRLNQVYAAYMNYNEKGGFFNTSGVLLTDAVMFAVGASHLELGDGHMLCHEYFPNSNMKMSDELEKSIVNYYDFMTAYQNFLRDGGKEITADLVSGNSSVTINAWPPRQQTVTTYTRILDNRMIVNLLNFRQANSLSWRDMDGTQPEPSVITNLPVRLNAAGVKNIWVASPDSLGGAPQKLIFHQEGNLVNFTVPSLKYWTMIVVEK